MKYTAGNFHSSPLHSAAASNYSTLLAILLDELVKNYDDLQPYLNAKDSDGDTPLMWAIEKKQLTNTKTLLDHGSTFFHIFSSHTFSFHIVLLFN